MVNLFHGYVLEGNVVILALGCIFWVSLYQHIKLRHTTMRYILQTFFIMCVDLRLFIIRGLTLIGYTVCGVLGILAAKHPSAFIFLGYMLASFITLIFILATLVIQFMEEDNRRYFTRMLLYDIWMSDHIELLEGHLDCCGLTGVTDYESANRTWSKASCCELDDCEGCIGLFDSMIVDIQKDIIRDNLVLMIFLLIDVLLMSRYICNTTLVPDPSESDDDDEPNQAKSETTSIRSNPLTR